MPVTGLRRVVWLTGMPRSGTTWVSQIFASSPGVRVKFCPLFSHEFKNRLDLQSTAADWERLFQEVYRTRGEFLDQEHLRKAGLVPAFARGADEPPLLLIKSNRQHHLTEDLLRKHPGVTFVGLVRDPRAAIFSWLDNPLEFPEGADAQAEWRSGACRKDHAGEFWGFDDWKRVTALFLRLEREWPERFVLVRYEDLVADAEARARDLFRRLDVPWSDGPRDFLRASHARHQEHRRSVFKDPAVADRWRGRLAPDIQAAIQDELAGTELARFLVAPACEPA